MVLLIYILLQIGDLVTTLRALKVGGHEVNPIARKAFDVFGVLGGLIILKVVGIGSGVILYMTGNVLALLLLTVLYFLVVVSNYFGWLKK